MIILDTNVVSELMRREPNPIVEAWVSARAASSLYLSAISEAELRYGVAIMPAGRRRAIIARKMDEVLREDFAGRILAFDSDAANAYAEIAATRRAAGRPVSQADCQTAATARSRGAAVATRNIRDFAEMGVRIIDPWTSGP